MMADATLLSQQVNTSCQSHTELEGEIVVGTMHLLWGDVMHCKESTFGGCLVGLLKIENRSGELTQQ